MNPDSPVFHQAAINFRPTIMGTRHVMVAGQYTAAHVGFEILEAGGNAVDAGVAAGIAVGVLQSYAVNFGGVAPILCYMAKTREVFSIDGLGVWPNAMTPDYFQRHHGGKMPSGVLRSIVPAAPDAWITALARFGTMSFGEVAAAAIRLAREGFPMYPIMSEFIKEKRDAYLRWPSSGKVYLPGGRAPEVGEIFVQKELANTLQYLADVEKAHRRKGRKAALRAARDAFYKGDIAAAIVKFHAQNGGLMRMEDFTGYSVKLEPTVTTKFNGIELHVGGPWCQGPVLPMALNLLKGCDLKALGHNTPEYIHVVTEALKLAFADRHQYFGDPNFVKVPIKGLMSERYAVHRRGLIDTARAHDGMPPVGNPASLIDFPAQWMPPPQLDTDPGPGDTTSLCCVDRHGNAFSATPSDSSNSQPLIPGIGILCSGRGSQAWVDPGHPSSVAPGKRPRLTPMPAIALKYGRAYMPFGTPGGDVQPQTMLQVFLNVNVFGMDVQRAIEAPRFAAYSFPGSGQPHEYFPGRLYLEARIPKATAQALSRLGHKIYWWDEWSWLAGAPCAIVVDHKTGVRHGGADLRRPAYAVGW